jgi:hypothetical protein
MSQKLYSATKIIPAWRRGGVGAEGEGGCGARRRSGGGGVGRARGEACAGARGVHGEAAAQGGGAAGRRVGERTERVSGEKEGEGRTGEPFISFLCRVPVIWHTAKIF